MTIREGNEQDYEKLTVLFKNFFKTHNVFQKSDEEIVSYLKDQKDKLLVKENNNEIQGALFLVNFGSNSTHKLWKFRHFAFSSEETAKELLNEAENIIKELSETSKIELTISETEEGIEFYKVNGYQQEGELKNHYRQGETCFILSK
jgi:hypothetical protein